MKYGDLLQQHLMIWGAMRNLMLQAETSDRPMTKMQVAAFDRLHTDLDAIDRQLRRFDAPVTAAPARTIIAYHGGGYIADGTITSAQDTIAAGSITATQIWAAAPEPEACSCGYRTECAIWCGNGHEPGGRCTDHPHRIPASAMEMLNAAERECRRMDTDYERNKELYATTGEQAYYDKMLENVYIE